MDVSFDFISGVRIGFEFIPADVTKEVFGDEYKGGLMLDLIIVNIILAFK